MEYGLLNLIFVGIGGFFFFLIVIGFAPWLLPIIIIGCIIGGAILGWQYGGRNDNEDGYEDNNYQYNELTEEEQQIIDEVRKRRD